MAEVNTDLRTKIVCIFVGKNIAVRARAGTIATFRVLNTEIYMY